TPATPIAEVTKTRVAAERFSHDIKSSYSGVSPVINSRQSRTPLRTADFGTAPNLTLTERDNAILTPLQRQYGNRQFVRGNADTGILNRAIRKGILRHVSGDPTHESAKLQFVR